MNRPPSFFVTTPIIALVTHLFCNPCQAETVTLYGKLTPQSAYDMNDLFVRNSGLVDSKDPENATVILAQVADMDPQDFPILEAALQDWIKTYTIDDFKIRVARAEHRKDRIVLLCDHTLDEAACLRDQVKNILKTTSFPSGRTYDAFSSKRGVFVPIIDLGVAGNLKAKKTVQLINLRLYDDRMIYPEPHFHIQVESLRVEAK